MLTALASKRPLRGGIDVGLATEKFTDEGLYMLMLTERNDVVHMRSVTWRQFAEFGYELKFP